MSRTCPDLARRNVLRGAAVAVAGAVLLKDASAARALLVPVTGQSGGVRVGVTLDMAEAFYRAKRAELREWLTRLWTAESFAAV